MFEQFIKFALVGITGIGVDFGITYALKEWVKANKYIANSLGFICANSSNYILNRLWTFRSTDPDVARQYLVFIGIALVALVLNNIVVWLCTDKMKLNFYFSKLVAVAVVGFWNFFMNYFFNF